MSCEEVVNVQLVREVQKHPVLYNYRLTDYSKRELVEAAWNQIAEVMKDEPLNCKEKWRNLRTVFVRKLKPLPNGAAKRKSYYLRDAMAFLTPFIKVQKSEDVTENASSPVHSESENAAFFEEPDTNEYDDGENSIQPESIASNRLMNHPHTNPQGCQTRRAVKNKDTPFPEYVEVKRSRYAEPGVPDDSRKYFLLSLLPEIQKLTDNQMKFFRRKMLDALDEAEAYPAHSGPAGMFNEDNTQNGMYFQEFSPKREC